MKDNKKIALSVISGLFLFGCLLNYNQPKNYKIGDRIGQMVFVNYPHVKLIQREELTETVRGANGFGSTGN